MKDHNPSCKKAIREQLLSGQKITVQSVLSTIRTQELRSYVSALKKEGLNIESEWISANGKHFKKYFIRQEEKAA